jgi:ZIP family zinc transporter
MSWSAILGLALLPGLATALGALPALFVRRVSPSVESVLLGFGAGVMLAASFLSLLAPALEAVGGLRAVGALLVGAAAVSGLHRLVPHEHFAKGPEPGLTVPGAAARTEAERARAEAVRRTWLFVAAITLHNVPEGLAVGVGLATGEAAVSLPIAVGIALQNVPEGLVVALSLLAAGSSRAASAGIGVASGLVEPVASGLGLAAVAVVSGVLPYALAAAAGAMIYVVSGEIIPESHRMDRSEPATWGTLIGFAAMTLLAVAFAA